MERATPGDRSRVDGWLARYLAVAGGGKSHRGRHAAATRAPSRWWGRRRRWRSRASARSRSPAAPRRRRAAPRSSDALSPTEPKARHLGARRVGDARARRDRPLAGVDRATAVVYPDERARRTPSRTRRRSSRPTSACARSPSTSAAGITTPTRSCAPRTSAATSPRALAAFIADLGARGIDHAHVLGMTEFGRRGRRERQPRRGSRPRRHHAAPSAAASRGGRVLARRRRVARPRPDRLYRGQDLAGDDRLPQRLRRGARTPPADRPRRPDATILPGSRSTRRNFRLVRLIRISGRAAGRQVRSAIEKLIGRGRCGGRGTAHERPDRAHAAQWHRPHSLVASSYCSRRALRSRRCLALAELVEARVPLLDEGVPAFLPPACRSSRGRGLLEITPSSLVAESISWSKAAFRPRDSRGCREEELAAPGVDLGLESIERRRRGSRRPMSSRFQRGIDGGGASTSRAPSCAPTTLVRKGTK